MKKSEAFEILRKEVIAGIVDDMDKLTSKLDKYELMLDKLQLINKDKYD